LQLLVIAATLLKLQMLHLQQMVCWLLLLLLLLGTQMKQESHQQLQ
jgi:hypothetical protein